MCEDGAGAAPTRSGGAMQAQFGRETPDPPTRQAHWKKTIRFLFYLETRVPTGTQWSLLVSKLHLFIYLETRQRVGVFTGRKTATLP